MEMPFLKQSGNGEVSLAVYIQPKASRNAICCIHAELLKVAVTSPPVDGKANKALASFLAKEFGVSKSDITLASGLASRRKVFRISGKSIEDIRGHIESVLKK